MKIFKLNLTYTQMISIEIDDVDTPEDAQKQFLDAVGDYMQHVELSDGFIEIMEVVEVNESGEPVEATNQ